MPSVKRHIDINTTSEKLFSVLVDYMKYPEFIPEIEDVELILDETHVKTILLRIKLFAISIDITLKMLEEPYRKISWQLIESNWLKKVNGYWQIENLEKGKSRATYHQDVKISGMIPKIASDTLINLSLPNLLQQFKYRAENIV